VGVNYRRSAGGQEAARPHLSATARRDIGSVREVVKRKNSLPFFVRPLIWDKWFQRAAATGGRVVSDGDRDRWLPELLQGVCLPQCCTSLADRATAACICQRRKAMRDLRLPAVPATQVDQQAASGKWQVTSGKLQAARPKPQASAHCTGWRRTVPPEATNILSRCREWRPMLTLVT
jgi:hypothetical protein